MTQQTFRAAETKKKELLNYGISSDVCEQIPAADSQLPFSPLVSACRYSKIGHTLHFLHAPQCGIVAQVQRRCDLAWAVVLLGLDLDRLATHQLFVSALALSGQRFRSVLKSCYLGPPRQEQSGLDGERRKQKKKAAKREVSGVACHLEHGFVARRTR